LPPTRERLRPCEFSQATSAPRALFAMRLGAPTVCAFQSFRNPAPNNAYSLIAPASRIALSNSATSFIPERIQEPGHLCHPKWVPGASGGRADHPQGEYKIRPYAPSARAQGRTSRGDHKDHPYGGFNPRPRARGGIVIPAKAGIYSICRPFIQSSISVSCIVSGYRRIHRGSSGLRRSQRAELWA